MKTLLLMPEFECWCTWEGEAPAKNIDPCDLPISRRLLADLLQWDKAFEDTYNAGYPPDSQFKRPAEAAAFDEEGRALAARLAVELVTRTAFYIEAR